MKYQVLDDGTHVLLREPAEEDRQQSLEFFERQRPEDLRYLRINPVDAGVVERRITQALSGDVYRLWAFVDDHIAGDGALEFSGGQWGGHLGEIRVIVDPAYHRRGLASLLIQDLFQFARDRRLEKIVMKMLEPQLPIRTFCEKLGFHVDAVVPDYAKDLEGKTQSLVIMTCTLDEWFHGMRGVYEDDQWDG